ncbi:MAG: amino acid permease [Gemmatimonadales bacterium]|nr:amino acid permease [Gemmatimonadales bacterium]
MAFGLAVLVGNTIATGIMRTPGEVATQLPSAGLFIAIWVVGGLYALLGAMSLAEGGIITKRSGGQYPIVRRALGPYPAFVVGWSDWFSIAASTSLGAIVFAEFALPLLPDIPGGVKAVASAIVLAFGWLQWNGVKSGDVAQQILSGLKALAFGVLIVAGFVMAVPEFAVAAPVVLPTGTGLVAGVILALQAVIFTYDGWTGPLYFGEETVNVEHTMPRTMIGGVLLVILIYLGFNLAMLRVVGIDAMAGDQFVAGTAGAILFGPKGDLVIRIVVLIAVLGGINSNILFGARVPMAMARDGLMPTAIERVNDGGTPVVAHALSVVAALAFIITGTFNSVLALAAFFFVANYLISFTAIFALRRKEPDTPRPFRVPGFPWTTGVVLVGSAAFLIGAVLSDRTNSLWSIALLAASWPVYRMIVKREA